MDILNELKQYKKVFIYGAGKIGKLVVEKLVVEYPEIAIEGVIISQGQKNPYYIFGKPVYYIDEVLDLAEESIVLIATLERIQFEIKENLCKYNFLHICCMTDELSYQWEEEKINKENKKISQTELFCKRYQEPYLQMLVDVCNFYQLDTVQISKYVRQALLELNLQQLDIARLVVVLGTKCSLRCKECNNLMPYFKPQKDLDLQTIITSLDNILQKARTVLKCELIGGEPFLSENLTEVLKFLLEKKNVYQIEITTNGTMIPKTELVAYLQCSKVLVRISDYGELVNKSTIIDFLKNNNIRYHILEIENWISSGDIEKRNREILDLQKLYFRCYVGYFCKTLYDGKLFSCTRAASLYALGCMREEFVTINENVSQHNIIDFLMKSYSEACDYCDKTIDEKKIVETAEQL